MNEYMSLALQLAERGRLTVSPNPMVGCVIVKDNQIIGTGYHQYAGKAHAEIIALEQAGSAAKDATAYVSLEPCCHYGRTPPCTDALIQAGIKKVYVACKDPNPQVAGKGIRTLKAANIEVELGLLAAEAERLNAIFFHFIRSQTPFVIAKWAMSLDGKTVTHPHDSSIISCPDSHQSSHQLRHQVDAILIGANTAVLDNPLLTVRLNSENAIKHPLRVILTTDGNLPLSLRLFADSTPGKTLIATTDAISAMQHKAYNKKNIQVLILPKNNLGKVDLSSLLKALGKLMITSLLIEGGRKIHESFFQENLIHQLHIYLSPVIIGSQEKKQVVSNLNFTKLGSDVYLTADYPVNNHV